MNRTLSKQYRRQAEEWCFKSLYASFPEEVVNQMTRKELWKLPFKETHVMEKCRHTWALSTDSEEFCTYKRMRLFRKSPRWFYQRIKKNPDITYDELMRMA